MTGLTSIFGGEIQGRDPVSIEPSLSHRIAYRRQLIRALNNKLRRGIITREDYWKFRRAAYSPAFMDGFIDEVMVAAKASGDFLEDVRAWFKILADWLIENWDTVLKILLTLIMLI